jgi:hypothetical protein
MRAEIMLMGKRIDMASRRRRRALVIVIYTVLAVLTACGWGIDHWRSTGALLYWAALLACWLFLGGYYTRGLVKPFNGKGPRNDEAMPSDLQLVFGLYRQPADDSEYRNDERELRARDHAHYRAYQGMGWALVALWAPVYSLILKPQWMARLTLNIDQIVYGIILIWLVLYTTLPQAILLWTEPDMEPEA